MENKDKHIVSEERFDKLVLLWMEDGLSDEERDEVESDPRFAAYKLIADGAKNISAPKLDDTSLLAGIKTKIDQPKPNKVRIVPMWKRLAGAAIVAVLALGVIAFINRGVHVDSYDAIQISHALPDGSQVILNSNSEVSYSDDFEDERILKLEGEAFFEVERGSSFIVETRLGKVQVLGTSFNVTSRKNRLIVACKTGKVSVQWGTNAHILTQGDRIIVRDGLIEKVDKVMPTKINDWTQGESHFERMQLQDVVMALEHKYNIKISIPEIYKEKLFTGGFVHHDLELATKMVLTPMGIPYTIIEGRVMIED